MTSRGMSDWLFDASSILVAVILADLIATWIKKQLSETTEG